MLGLDNTQIQELLNSYYTSMKNALSFQTEGNIIEYTKNLIEARKIADQLEYVYVQN